MLGVEKPRPFRVDYYDYADKFKGPEDRECGPDKETCNKQLPKSHFSPPIRFESYGDTFPVLLHT